MESKRRKGVKTGKKKEEIYDDYYHSDEELVQKTDPSEFRNMIHNENILWKDRINSATRSIIKNPLSDIDQEHNHLIVTISKNAQFKASRKNDKLSLISQNLRGEITKDVFFLSTETNLMQLESDFIEIKSDSLINNIAHMETENHTKCIEILFDHSIKKIYCLFILDNRGVFFVLMAFEHNEELKRLVTEGEHYTLNSSALAEGTWKIIYDIIVKYTGYCYINCPCFSEEQ